LQEPWNRHQKHQASSRSEDMPIACHKHHFQGILHELILFQLNSHHAINAQDRIVMANTQYPEYLHDYQLILPPIHIL